MVEVNLRDFFPLTFEEDKIVLVTENASYFHTGVNNPPKMRGFFPAIRRISKGKYHSDWFIHINTLDVLQAGFTTFKLSELYRDEISTIEKLRGKKQEQAAELLSLRQGEVRNDEKALIENIRRAKSERIALLLSLRVEQGGAFVTVENNLADRLFFSRQEEIEYEDEARKNSCYTSISLAEFDRIESDKRYPSEMTELGNPAVMFERKEERFWERRFVCCALNSLSEEQRGCVYAHIVEGKLQKKVAAENNIDPSTVSINISRALENMRVQIEASYHKTWSKNCAQCKPAIRLINAKHPIKKEE